jgi:hypothetical protein
MNLGGILGWGEEKKGMIFEGAFKKGAGQREISVVALWRGYYLRDRQALDINTIWVG